MKNKNVLIKMTKRGKYKSSKRRKIIKDKRTENRKREKRKSLQNNEHRSTFYY